MANHTSATVRPYLARLLLRSPNHTILKSEARRSLANELSLSEYDLVVLKAQIPRWWHRVLTSVAALRENGILLPESSSTRGIWTLTDPQGIAWAREEFTSVANSSALSQSDVIQSMAKAVSERTGYDIMEENPSELGEFITSRGFSLPKSTEKMAGSLWYNMWQRKLWPYLELQEGSTLYWYDTTEEAIVWKSRVSKIEKFEYLDKNSIKERLQSIFGDNNGFDSYFEEKPGKGYCVAFKVDSLLAIRLSKPIGYRFPQIGWLRRSDDQAEGWFALLPKTDANAEDADSYHPTGEDRRAIALEEIRQRQGQITFRKKLIERYGPACMVSDCTVIDVVEAAHIRPYRCKDDNDPHNGLLLRSDLHTLFDAGLLAIEPKTLIIRLDASLKATEYAKFDGQKLLCLKRKPSDRALRIKWGESKVGVEPN